MSAVERLEAAITKLEAQAHEASNGPWQAHIEHGDYTTSAELFDVEGGYVVSDGYVVDIELIVTLHRTIEPQLAILQDGLLQEQARAKYPDYWYSPVDPRVLALADAILGGA